MDFEVPPHDQQVQIDSLEHVRRTAEQTGVAIVMGMEWESEAGLLNTAFVISRDWSRRGSADQEPDSG